MAPSPAPATESSLKEIHHRVKNNLQVICSLLSLQSRYARDEETAEMFRESQNRVRSMALVYERLARSNHPSQVNFAEYARSLLTNLLGAYGVDSNRVHPRVEPSDLLLGLDTAVPCGLLLNELVSNAVKHAFPEERSGEIRVRLRSREDGQLELTISDDGVGLPSGLDPAAGEHLGLKLVMALTDQLSGRIEFSRGEGTEVRVTFKEVAYARRS